MRPETQPTVFAVRRLRGRTVEVSLASGRSEQGTLVSTTERALWLVASGADLFIPLDDVTSLRPLPL